MICNDHSTVSVVTLLTLTLAEVAVQLAGLTRDVSIPWVHNTEYATTNLTEATNLWESIDFDSGFIALPHDYAASKHLPKSQNFPWDQSKGIYVVNGYHSLHCLVSPAPSSTMAFDRQRSQQLRQSWQKSIHASLREFHLNQPQSYPLEHVTHCIDSLRRETLCAADDTPRWTSQDHDPESGVGQIRQCRDWSKLEAWVRKYNSCYNRINEEANFHPEIERYRFCPPGSPYGDLMRAYFERVRHKKIEDPSRPGG